jgi:Mn-containing catalase
MFVYSRSLTADLSEAKPDAAAAATLDRLAGAAYALATRYLVQSLNFRGRAYPYRDLIHAVALEQLNLAELAGAATRELDGRVSPPPAPVAEDAGDLVAQLRADAEAERRSASELEAAHGETDHPQARVVIAHLLVRAVAHRRAFEHALATLGVDEPGGEPEPDLTRFPEAAAALERGLDRRQYDWSTDGSYLGLILRDAASSGVVASGAEPERFPYPTGAAGREEFAPGLPPDVQARAEEISNVKDWKGAPVF